MPPIDYTTSANVFAYGKVYNPTLDETAVMDEIVTAVSRRIDKDCVQQFSLTTYTNVIMTPRIDVEGTLILYLPSPTITALTSITLRAGNIPLTQPINYLGTGAQYDIINQSFGSKVLVYGFTLTPYRNSVLRAYVSWQGGWANLSQVPSDFELAARIYSWYAYKQREAPFDRTAIPEMGIITLPGTTPASVTNTLNRYTWYYR